MNTVDTSAQSVPKYMTPPKFASYTGLPLRLVRQMMKSGELEGFTVNGKVNYILVESYRNIAHSLANG